MVSRVMAISVAESSDVNHKLLGATSTHCVNASICGREMGEGMVAQFIDRTLRCVDCGEEFVFSAGEQLFFHDKQFVNDPKRCKTCKAKQVSGQFRLRTDTRINCAACGLETTVPFRPTKGKPVFCHSCFQNALGENS